MNETMWKWCVSQSDPKDNNQHMASTLTFNLPHRIFNTYNTYVNNDFKYYDIFTMRAKGSKCSAHRMKKCFLSFTFSKIHDIWKSWWCSMLNVWAVFIQWIKHDNERFFFHKQFYSQWTDRERQTMALNEWQRYDWIVCTNPFQLMASATMTDE